MKKRNMKGIPKLEVNYGDKVFNACSPLHRRLGIRTFNHRQAILDDPRLGRRYDRISRSWNHQHLYRENITLAAI